MKGPWEDGDTETRRPPSLTHYCHGENRPFFHVPGPTVTTKPEKRALARKTFLSLKLLGSHRVTCAGCNSSHQISFDTGRLACHNVMKAHLFGLLQFPPGYHQS